MTLLCKSDKKVSPIYYLKSYAKLNLTLTITGKRSDGFHLLKSLFAYTDLHDIIAIQPNSANCPSFKTQGQFCFGLRNDFDSMNNNLIMKAIELMHKEFAIPTNFDIILQKNIPVSSGLGGGSSNAATIIRFLNNFFDLKISSTKLIQLAQSLGSDIPFFMQPKMAICEGIGEIIKPVNLEQKETYAVLICYGLKASTQKIYKQLRISNNHPQQDYNTELDLNKILQIIINNGNDLTDPAIHFSPSISKVLSTLESSIFTLASGMSGAGPTCFAICKNNNSADRLAFSLRSSFGNCFIKKVKILPVIEFENIMPSYEPNLFHSEKDFNLLAMQ